MSSEKIIKIDIDGVLRNIMPYMCYLYNFNFKTDIKAEDVIEYDLEKTFTKCREIENISAYEWFFNKYGSLINRYSPLMEDALSAIELLREKGYYIIIVSYQNTINQKRDTIEWLSAKSVYYDSLCFTNKKGLIQGDIIVDDNPEFLDKCSYKERKILIDAPYNRSYNCYERFNSLYEFVKAL